MARNIYLAIFWTFVSLASAENRTCYHLDGSEASNHVPCTSNDVTNCCASNDLCLSNGLCYLQGSQGLTLTRGTCTDSGWGSDCYAPCSNYRRNTGLPIMNIAYNYSDTQYCCGAVVADNGDIGCKYESPFTLAEATVIPGVAFLENNGVDNSSSSTDCKSSSQCVAVEAGISVPLGIIAIACFAWALWERRRQRTPRYLHAGESEVAYPTNSHQKHAVELHSSHGPVGVSELMDSRQECKEAPGENVTRT